MDIYIDADSRANMSLHCTTVAVRLGVENRNSQTRLARFMWDISFYFALPLIILYTRSDIV